MELLESIDSQSWLYRIVAACIILFVTWVVVHYVSRLVHRVLRRDDVDLPANSIFVNILRVCLWLVGASIALHYCFDIDMGGVITALGVGGIALSLGFQDTLSDLIGGVLITMSRTVETDDAIRYGTAEGRVLDVNWRSTRVRDVEGNIHVIPNSTLSNAEVVKLEGNQTIHVPVLVPESDNLEGLVEEMRRIAHEAVTGIVETRADTRFVLIGNELGGFSGDIQVVVPWFSIPSWQVQGEVTKALAGYLAPASRQGSQPAELPSGKGDRS